MTNPGWKQFERRIAKRLGGRRVGILGKEDVEHPILSIETKLYKDVPKFIMNTYGQAKKNCPKAKIPIVCLKEKKRIDDNAFVILSLADFEIFLNGGSDED